MPRKKVAWLLVGMGGVLVAMLIALLTVWLLRTRSEVVDVIASGDISLAAEQADRVGVTVNFQANSDGTLSTTFSKDFLLWRWEVDTYADPYVHPSSHSHIIDPRYTKVRFHIFGFRF